MTPDSLDACLFLFLLSAFSVAWLMGVAMEMVE